MTSNLKTLVHKLTQYTKADFKPKSVLNHLEEAQITPQCMEPYLHFEKDFYTRNLIAKTPHFEMLLLCWEPGQQTMIHDHASQGCWMTVLEGVITSENFKYQEAHSFDGALEKLSTQSFKIGQSYYIDDQVSLHLLKNPVKNNQRTASLHIYAKPFSQCTVYDLETRQAKPLMLRYHSIQGKKGDWLASEIEATRT